MVRLLAAFRAPGSKTSRRSDNSEDGLDDVASDTTGGVGVDENSICLVFEKMESDLSHFIRIRRGQ